MDTFRKAYRIYLLTDDEIVAYDTNDVPYRWDHTKWTSTTSTGTGGSNPVKPTQPAETTEAATEAPKPTVPPTTEAPTAAPTVPPTEPPTTEAPTAPPTEAPTAAPTEPPTAAPTETPTEAPTVPPTEPPTTEAPTVHQHSRGDWSFVNNFDGTHTHVRTCTTCGDTEQEGPVACSSFSVKENSRVEASCTAAGYTIYKCNDCGYEKWGDVVPALGHDFRWTSNGNGTHSGTCARCQESGGTQDCSFNDDHVCIYCGYRQPEETTPADPGGSSLPGMNGKDKKRRIPEK